MSEWIVDRIEDVRPYDWDTGEYGKPLVATGMKCDHCGQSHGIYFAVLNTSTNELKMLGEQCIPAATGWTPTSADLEKPKKKLAKAREVKRADTIHAYASEMADELVERVPHPPPPDLFAWFNNEILQLDLSTYPTNLIAKEVQERAVLLAVRKMAREPQRR